jgi:tetratricopeptide (TPR) repeat protein
LSDKADLRRESQSKLSSILFYDLQDFAGAVIEYSKLLALQHTMDEEIEWRSRIAKAYYYQGDYFQSKIEVDKALQLPLSEEALYQAQLLKANIAIGAREHEEAAKVLEQMIAKFPERAKKDSLSLMLAVAFEEQRNFAKAIETLERIRSYDSRKAFIKEKIQSLKERQGQQPGARGFRK